MLNLILYIVINTPL